MKDVQSHLLPECYGDTLLANILTKANCNHIPTISKVFVVMKPGGEFNKRKAVGIIDDDKKKDDYYKEFEIDEDTDCFKYLAHPNKLHFLVVFKKDLEDMLIKCGKLTGTKHRLLNDRDLLKDRMKKMKVSEDDEIKNLLNTLIQKKAEPLLRIKSILAKHKV